MKPDQDGSEDGHRQEPTLRFSVGRFEQQIITGIMIIQMTLVGVTVMAFGFVALSAGGTHPRIIGLSLVPLIFVMLLTLLYD